MKGDLSDVFWVVLGLKDWSCGGKSGDFSACVALSALACGGGVFS